MTHRNLRWVILAAGVIMVAAGWRWRETSAALDHQRPSSTTARSIALQPGASSTLQPGASSLLPPSTPAVAPKPSPADNAIVPPPASAIVKTIVDTTPRMEEMMKVFRVAADPSGLAAEALATAAGVNTPPLAVWPPVPWYSMDAYAFLRDGLTPAAFPDPPELWYFVEDPLTGKVVGEVDFMERGNKAPGTYTKPSLSPGQFSVTLKARALEYLASLKAVKAGSYEPRILSYGIPPVEVGWAIWLRSPLGDQDLFFPLPVARKGGQPATTPADADFIFQAPGGPAANSVSLMFGFEARIYPADAFYNQLRAGLVQSLQRN